ncbi:MAG: PAS domain-containing protein [Alphaproteobacteria bacterium]|nr:PAS domain-containing protein [Alphaproteobacteria bacterium]
MARYANRPVGGRPERVGELAEGIEHGVTGPVASPNETFRAAAPVADAERGLGAGADLLWFCHASPEAAAALGAHARAAYLDNPLPAVFKERLVVHLARACGVRPLAARHLGVLVGRFAGAGERETPPQAATDLCELLRRPARPAGRALEAALERLETRPLAPLDALDAAREADVFAAAGELVGGGALAPRARRALTKALAAAAVERIGLLAGYVRAIEAHLAGRDDAALERDVQALLADHVELAELLRAAPPADPTADAQMLRLALDGAAQGAWDYDVPADRPRWDERTFALFGLEPSAPLSYAHVLDDYVHPADRERVDRAARAALDPAGDGRYAVEHRIRRADGAERWLAVSGRTLFEERDGERRPVRMLGVARDVTADVEARGRAEANVERLRHALEAAAASAWEWTPDTGRIWWSAENFELFGLDPEAGVPDVAAWLERCVHPDDRAGVEADVRAALDGGDDTFALDYRIDHPDHGRRWITARGQIRRDAEGRPQHLRGLNFDTTASRRAEEALGASRAELDRQLAELQALYAQAPLGLGMLDRDLRFRRINAALAEINGIPAADHIGRGAWELLPDLQTSAEPVFRKVLETGEAEHDVAVRGTTPAQPGVEREWREHFYPIVATSGAVIGIGIICAEVTAARQAERQRELLIDELNHRVKNTLAVVQALAQQTFKSGADPEAARRAFDQRLQALAGAHELLTRANWEAASLAELVAAVVQGASPEGARLHAQGPPVTIAPKMAVTLAMTLNELYTNAVKYGALAVDDGRIDLAWSYDAADRVTLSWREHGGPPVAPPARKGFGLTMIEQALAREFGAEVALDFTHAGLVCRLRLPLDRPAPAPS